MTVPAEPTNNTVAASTQRLALGVGYRGQAYHGWQSQPGGCTVQDLLEAALAKFVGARSLGGAAAQRLATVCAGRTDAGVHALQQVVHLDPPVERDDFAWVRGTNTFLPPDIAVQWCRRVGPGFHARNSARSRRYRFVLLESSVRPALEAGLCGWVFRPLDGEAMRQAAALLLGEHDFTSFRASSCQSSTPVKTLRDISITRRGAYWRFDFEANAFLQHMVRNLMGCLLAVGQGRQPPGWVSQVLAARDRDAAAPTFLPDGLYFVGPRYDAEHGIPTQVPAMDWIP